MLRLMPSVYAKTLARATLIVGGVDALAVELGVAPQALASWLRLERDPPMDVFLRAVDIVVEDAVPQREVLHSGPPRRDGPPTP